MSTGSQNIFTASRLRWFAAAVVLLNGFFPAVWIFFTSLKNEVELTAKPITYFPHNPVLANYIAAFRDQPLASYLLNSAIVALCSMILSLTISAMARAVRAPQISRDSVSRPS